MAYWLVKSEPSTYSWAQLVKDKKTSWTGVRNPLAQKHLRAVQPRLGEVRIATLCLERDDRLDPITKEFLRRKLTCHIGVIQMTVGVD